MNLREHLQRLADRLAGVSDSPRLEAELLLAEALGRSRSWLHAWPEHQPDDAALARLEALVARRERGEPLAHLLGRREFWSLELAVDARVLVPRPETETLVEWALALDLPDDARVLDLGTGSGAIALALASERPGWRLTATDLDPDALAVARDNAVRLDLARRIDFRTGGWFEAVVGLPPFDLVCSNPPYIAEGDPHLERDGLPFEPRHALVSGAEGLDDLRLIVADAPAHLRPGGWLLLEHGLDQNGAVRDLLARHGFTDIETRSDLAGRPRVTGGRLNAPPEPSP